MVALRETTHKATNQQITGMIYLPPPGTRLRIQSEPAYLPNAIPVVGKKLYSNG